VSSAAPSQSFRRAGIDLEVEEGVDVMAFASSSRVLFAMLQSLGVISLFVWASMSFSNDVNESNKFVGCVASV
jgi:hypothetical protein